MVHPQKGAAHVREIMEGAVMKPEEKLLQIYRNITSESKLIDGRLCFKATLLQKSELLGKAREWIITAWFCPEIPVSAGPGSVGGLPGIILVLDSGNGAYVAKEVVFDDTITVEKPKMKRVMSSEEYMKKVMQNY
jgi:GLPGLI family protein